MIAEHAPRYEGLANAPVFFPGQNHLAGRPADAFNLRRWKDRYQGKAHPGAFPLPPRSYGWTPLILPVSVAKMFRVAEVDNLFDEPTRPIGFRHRAWAAARLPAWPWQCAMARWVMSLPLRCGSSMSMLIAPLALLAAISLATPVNAQFQTASQPGTLPDPVSSGHPLGTAPAPAGQGVPFSLDDGDHTDLDQPAMDIPYGNLPASHAESDGNATVLHQPGYVKNPPTEQSGSHDGGSTWELMPAGLLYPAYLAGIKESRFGTQWSDGRNNAQVLDSTLGAHVGVLRWGTVDGPRPEGFQWDLEGAAFPRLEVGDNTELESTDYRFGSQETLRSGPWEGKFGYYHLCAHLGDKFLMDNPTFPRVDYVRDALVLGIAVRPLSTLRFYSEVGCAVHVTGEAEPWEFQFGGEYLQAEPEDWHGGPFAALNCHLRQENNFGGNVDFELGQAWRVRDDRLTRVGLFYFNGMSEQYQFYMKHEDQVGLGVWYDF